MKYWSLSLVLICLAACGQSEAPQAATKDDVQRVADQAVAEAQEIVDQTLSGKKPVVKGEGLEGCNVFDSGLIPGVFGVDASKVDYRRSMPVPRAGHLLCSASWDKPDKADLDKAYTAEMTEWAVNKAKGQNTPMPKQSNSVNKVSLTLVADTFQTPAEAVANLESAVATLSEGISFEVKGKKHETRMSFGDWIDGVGDKAIFSDKGELMVAADARRFSIIVSVMGDEAQDLEKAIEVAQRIIDTF